MAAHSTCSLTWLLITWFLTSSTGAPPGQSNLNLYRPLPQFSLTSAAADRRPDTQIVEYFEKIGGSIVENPFPTPTIVKSIRLEQVQIEPALFEQLLSNCLEVEGFHFKPYDPTARSSGREAYELALTNPDRYAVFDLSVVSLMKNHHFAHFILEDVTVQFSLGAAPPLINAYQLVTFFESRLPPDFTSLLARQFPTVNTLNLVEAVISDPAAGEGSWGERGIRASDLEFLLSGKIPSLRHVYIRGFNWNVESDKLRSIFVGLGCPNVRDYIFLDKDFDVWEC